VIEELRGAFRHFVSEGRLAAIIYYDWSDKLGREAGIFRCGALTAAGKLSRNLHEEVKGAGESNEGRRETADEMSPDERLADRAPG